jgi:hypothetical protein
MAEVDAARDREAEKTMTTYLLIIQSLVVLSTTEVKVVPLKETIQFETMAECKVYEKEVRAKGAQWQARCLRQRR